MNATTRQRNSSAPLSTTTCWELLRTVGVGRVAYSDRALPAIAQVPFAIDGERIVILLDESTSEYASLRGAVIAFQADHDGSDGQPGWSVSCVGKPYPHRAPASGSPGVMVLALEPEILQGRLVATVG